jgi:uroporphyrinogen III methyltransferase/synthase
MARGTVYLVGAGPGDPGLLTIRGWQVLRLADVVFYDGLVGRGVLRLIPRRARKLRVAKGPRHRDRFPQSRINQLLVMEAEAGRQVVRLKGGDAFLFSRGGEEAEALQKRGIRFEVVPGVTSALAGPAFAGIPLTERQYASSVAIATGRESGSPFHRAVNWAGLARSADTLVILMGVATLKRVARQLLDGGLPPDTPVAAVQWATTPRQRTLLFTLGEANRNSLRTRLRSPCVLVVGPTVVLAHRLNWNPRETRWASARFARVAKRTEAANRISPGISSRHRRSYNPRSGRIGAPAEERDPTERASRPGQVRERRAGTRNPC